MAIMKDMGISLAYHEPALPPRLSAGLAVGTFTLQPLKTNLSLGGTESMATFCFSDAVTVHMIHSNRVIPCNLCNYKRTL
jgi:hypothetical protein